MFLCPVPSLCFDLLSYSFIHNSYGGDIVDDSGGDDHDGDDVMMTMKASTTTTTTTTRMVMVIVLVCANEQIDGLYSTPMINGMVVVEVSSLFNCGQ